MSDERIETGGGKPAGEASAVNEENGGDDRNTNTNPPEVKAGQPVVGDDRPRSTEF